MADLEIFDLAALTALASGDVFPVVDVSDTTGDANGTTKKITVANVVAGMQALGHPRVKSVGSTHSISSTTGTEITDLTMALEAGTYVVDYYLIVRSATVTVSPMLGLNFDGTAAVKSFIWFWADSTASVAAEVHKVSAEGVNTWGFISGRATRTYTTTAPNLGNTAANAMESTATDHPMRITGLLIVTVAGNLELWHSSETATATSVEVGSSLVVVRTA